MQESLVAGGNLPQLAPFQQPEFALSECTPPTEPALLFDQLESCDQVNFAQLASIDGDGTDEGVLTEVSKKQCASATAGALCLSERLESRDHMDSSVLNTDSGGIGEGVLTEVLTEEGASAAQRAHSRGEQSKAQEHVESLLFASNDIARTDDSLPTEASTAECAPPTDATIPLQLANIDGDRMHESVLTDASTNTNTKATRESLALSEAFDSREPTGSSRLSNICGGGASEDAPTEASATECATAIQGTCPLVEQSESRENVNFAEPASATSGGENKDVLTEVSTESALATSRALDLGEQSESRDHSSFTQFANIERSGIAEVFTAASREESASFARGILSLSEPLESQEHVDLPQLANIHECRMDGCIPPEASAQQSASTIEATALPGEQYQSRQHINSSQFANSDNANDAFTKLSGEKSESATQEALSLSKQLESGEHIDSAQLANVERCRMDGSVSPEAFAKECVSATKVGAALGEQSESRNHIDSSPIVSNGGGRDESFLLEASTTGYASATPAAFPLGEHLGSREHADSPMRAAIDVGGASEGVLMEASTTECASATQASICEQRTGGAVESSQKSPDQSSGLTDSTGDSLGTEVRSLTKKSCMTHDKAENNSLLCSSVTSSDELSMACDQSVAGPGQIQQRSDSAACKSEDAAAEPTTKQPRVNGEGSADSEEDAPISKLGVLSLLLCYQNGDLSARVRLRSTTSMRRLMIAAVGALELGHMKDACFSYGGRKIGSSETPASLRLSNDSKIVACKASDCVACRNGSGLGHGLSADLGKPVPEITRTETSAPSVAAEGLKQQKSGGMGWEQYRSAMRPVLQARLEEKWQHIAHDSQALELLAWRHERCSSDTALPGRIANQLSAELDALIAKRSHDAESRGETSMGAEEQSSKRARTCEQQTELQTEAGAKLLAELGLDVPRMPSPLLLFLKLTQGRQADPGQALSDAQAQLALSRWARLNAAQRKALWNLVAQDAALVDKEISEFVRKRSGGRHVPTPAPVPGLTEGSWSSLVDFVLSRQAPGRKGSDPSRRLPLPWVCTEMHPKGR
eukprot:TRINITY_DN8057_c0_g1_i1.p1 TRINITY_DN8057_c0_g1~~TRINITY_DN8057_c0_g1_i1.p1  ORF type:complete len:1071 (-),score=161.03 TRINITY_DN8057_c0_g1_i1:50-3211(-)